MFQVEPERVFFALGAPKDRKERQAGRRIRARSAKNSVEAAEEEAEPVEKEDADNSEPTPSSTSPNDTSSTTSSPTDRTPKKTLLALLAQAKTILATPTTSVTARRKQDLRAFQRTVKKTLSRPEALMTSTLDTQLKEILARIGSSTQQEQPPGSTTTTTTKADEAPQMSTAALQAEAASLNPAQMLVLRDALTQARENPIDASKPYATPWRPRDFISPFAFIPNYLEVHQKVCSAVYLRHPVARPGLGEVPTPFHSESLGLAHNWYLKRR